MFSKVVEWLGVQTFQVSFSCLIGVAVVAMGEIDNVVEKYGVGAVIAAVALLLGKYFAFRPKTIESQAAARRSDMEIARIANEAVIKQLNDIHKERCDNLLATIADYKDRLNKAEASVAAGRHTRHLMGNVLGPMQLRIKVYEMQLEQAQLPFNPYPELDMESLTAEEDEVLRKTKVEPTVKTAEAATAVATARTDVATARSARANATTQATPLP